MRERIKQKIIENKMKHAHEMQFLVQHSMFIDIFSAIKIDAILNFSLLKLECKASKQPRFNCKYSYEIQTHSSYTSIHLYIKYTINTLRRQLTIQK